LDANEGMFDQTGGTGAITGLGDGAVRAQLSGPYHAFGAISAWRSVGISVESITSLGLPVGGGLNAAVTLDYAVPTGGSYQQQDPSSVLTYPCQASTGVNYRLTNESPSPVPGRNLVTTPLGPAVLVMLRQGRVLTITSATMTNLTTGLPVTLRTPVTSANDPANFFSAFGAYMGYIIPDAPIAQNTAHQVTINGTNNGTAFSRTFTFTSGTGG
jgi:hypothetical protein